MAIIKNELIKDVTIHIKVCKFPKLRGVIKAHTKFERDLKSCMQCRFFYGSNNQCVAKKCVKEDLRSISEKKKDKMCYGCPYQQKGGACGGFKRSWKRKVSGSRNKRSFWFIYGQSYR